MMHVTKKKIKKVFSRSESLQTKHAVVCDILFYVTVRIHVHRVCQLSADLHTVWYLLWLEV